jgi:organic hydroperoxide reductase OsmC/OhrA
VRGLVPGISDDEFVTMAALVADSCPVSQALSGIDVSLDAATS